MASTAPVTTTRDPPVLSKKLLVDEDAQRVVFAEAGKDVVGFLFSLLELPLGRVAKLVQSTDGKVGSVDNLYARVESLDPAHVQPSAAKGSLLHPTVLSPPALTENIFVHPLRTPLYTCTSIYSSACGTYLTDGRGTRCRSCGDEMRTVTRYVPAGLASRRRAPRRRCLLRCMFYCVT